MDINNLHFNQCVLCEKSFDVGDRVVPTYTVRRIVDKRHVDINDAYHSQLAHLACVMI